MNIYCNTDRFLKEVLHENEYAFLFKDNLTVVDLGCNIGAFSFWIYQMAKKIHAIDLSKENISKLNQTISENKLNKIKTHHCGIAGKTGKRAARDESDPSGGGWSLKEEVGDHQCYSLTEFMSRESIPYIDLLKMDVEGAELEIVEGNFPANLVHTIIGEHHYSEDQRNKFELRLVHLGYDYTEMTGNHFLARRRP